MNRPQIHWLTPKNKKRKSPYTVDRGIPGAFEGETVTRRGLFTGGAMAAGGIATAAFALPALGFALGPIFKDDEVNTQWQDVGPEADFNTDTYVAARDHDRRRPSASPARRRSTSARPPSPTTRPATSPASSCPTS